MAELHEHKLIPLLPEPSHRRLHHLVAPAFRETVKCTCQNSVEVLVAGLHDVESHLDLGNFESAHSSLNSLVIKSGVRNNWMAIDAFLHAGDSFCDSILLLGRALGGKEDVELCKQFLYQLKAYGRQTRLAGG